MKYLIILVFILALIILYINRSYAYFYNFQGSHFIPNPYYPQSTEIGQDKKDLLKLVILGDSLMAGTGTTDVKNSLAYLIALEFAKENKVRLINYASPGVGVLDVLERQVPEAIAQKPDYIVLMIGTNDVHNKMTDRQFENYYDEILNILTSQTTSKITIVNIPYIGSSNILYPPWDTIAEGRIKEFNKIIENSALSYNLPVVDLYEEFKLQFKDSSDLYSFDEFHPSDKGYALWADYINAHLNR